MNKSYKRKKKIKPFASFESQQKLEREREASLQNFGDASIPPNPVQNRQPFLQKQILPTFNCYF